MIGTPPAAADRKMRRGPLSRCATSVVPRRGRRRRNRRRRRRRRRDRPRRRPGQPGRPRPEPRGRSSTHAGEGHGRFAAGAVSMRRPPELAVQPHHPLLAEELDAPGGAPAEDVVPHAGQVRLGTRGEGEGDGGQVFDALVSRRSSPCAVTPTASPRQKRRMSTSWMECSIRHPPPAWETSARHPEQRPPNRKVLVVTDGGRHRPAQGARRDQVPQGPKDRGGAEDQSRLRRDARRPTASTRARVPGGPGPAASRRRWRGVRAERHPPHAWAAVGVQTQTASQRATSIRSPATSAPWAAANPGPPGAPIEDHGDVGVDTPDAIIACSPARGPGDQARPDKPDPQHDPTLGGRRPR